MKGERKVEIIEVSWRTILLYVVIIIIFRFLGQRGINQLNVIDLVVVLMISELGVVAIEDTGGSLLYQLVPILILTVIQIGLTYNIYPIKKSKITQSTRWATYYCNKARKD